MTPYIEDVVEQVRDDPDEREEITLLIGSKDSMARELSEQIQDLGGEIEEELPFDTLKVRINQSVVNEICGLDQVESVETDAELESLGEPRFFSQEISNR